MARIKSRVFKHITEPNFLDFANFLMRDVCKVLGFEQYSMVLKCDSETMVDKVIEDWQIPERKQPMKIYKFKCQSLQAPIKEVLI